MNDNVIDNKNTEQRELKKKDKNNKINDKIDANAYITDNQKAYKVLKYELPPPALE